jgi:DnaJ-class molecular chaperone
MTRPDTPTTEPCSKCGGKGWYLFVFDDEAGFGRDVEIDCRKCGGTGRATGTEMKEREDNG